MSDNLFDLYSQKILDLAMEIPFQEPIDQCNGEALKRSPLCGSQVRVRVNYVNEGVRGYSQDVKACALGQASATIFGNAVIGLNLEDIVNLETQLRTFLTESAPIPTAPFTDYEALTPARAYKNRHASILLCVEATIEAIKKAAPEARQSTY